MSVTRSPPSRSVASLLSVAPSCSETTNSHVAAAFTLDAIETRQHSRSAPALNDSNEGIEDHTSNITIRSKRKFEDEADGTEMRSFTSGMRGMIASFTLSMEQRFNTLQDSVNEIKFQNEEISRNLSFSSEKYDELLLRFKTLEEEKKEDRKFINFLEDKVESLERKSLLTSIEIRNIPKATANNDPLQHKLELCQLVKNLGNALQVNLSDSDIKDIYRNNPKKDNSSKITVEFTSTLTKDKIISAIKSYNRSKPKGQKLNSENLKMSGPIKPVYVSESLTYKMQSLFFLARQFAKDYDYNICWTARGVVYLRKTTAAPYIRILNSSDLDKLKVI